MLYLFLGTSLYIAIKNGVFCLLSNIVCDKYWDIGLQLNFVCCSYTQQLCWVVLLVLIFFQYSLFPYRKLYLNKIGLSFLFPVIIKMPYGQSWRPVVAWSNLLLCALSFCLIIPLFKAYNQAVVNLFLVLISPFVCMGMGALSPVHSFKQWNWFWFLPTSLPQWRSLLVFELSKPNSRPTPSFVQQDVSWTEET